MRDFKNLDVWQRAHQLTLEVYLTSASFPRSETYGLRAQIRAAATSIEANIAEGAGRRTPSDYGRFLDMALASTNELECEILLALDLGYIDAITSADLVDRTAAVRRMLVGLRDAIAIGAASRPRVR